MATAAITIDVDEVRTWLNRHKAEAGQSWSQLATVIGVPQGTLSAFGGGTYQGRNDVQADQIDRYRRRLNEQAAIVAPEIPDWYDTPTATKLVNFMRWAQRGRMAMVVSAPGISKTKAAERYRDTGSNVWLATMSPATSGVQTMLSEIARSVGTETKGTPLAIADGIAKRVEGTGGLILVDEAQELSEKALNQLRALHDATRVGIVLMGNEEVVGRINNRAKPALAQIKSRLSMTLIIRVPLAGDLEALLDAWNIVEPAQRAYLIEEGLRPGCGALRECTQILDIATMAAIGDQAQLKLAHLKAAVAQRAMSVGG